MAASFSVSVKDIYLPCSWMALYLVERASIEPNLHNIYLDFLDHLMDSTLIGLTLQETYRHVGLALQADLSVDLSFDKAILKNLGRWLGLQTLGRGMPVSSEDLPLWDIVVTAFHRSLRTCFSPFHL